MSLEGFDTDISNKEVMRAIPEEIKRKINEHGAICDYLKDLYKTKNADYGDCMHPLFKEYGLTTFLVMLDIKLSRIKSLQYKSNHYESLEDSLLDLANYAMIAVTEIRDAKNNRK